MTCSRLLTSSLILSTTLWCFHYDSHCKSSRSWSNECRTVPRGCRPLDQAIRLWVVSLSTICGWWGLLLSPTLSHSSHEFVQSQAFLNKDCLLTYTFHGLVVHQIIQLYGYVFVCENNFLLCNKFIVFVECGQIETKDVSCSLWVEQFADPLSIPVVKHLLMMVATCDCVGDISDAVGVDRCSERYYQAASCDYNGVPAAIHKCRWCHMCTVHDLSGMYDWYSMWLV